MAAHQFHEPADAARFLFGGRAVLTVESLKTGAHYTYRVHRKEDENGKKTPFFIGLLTGPDNTSDYSYMGLLESDGRVRLTAKSRLRADSIPVKALEFVARHVVAGKMPPDAVVRHEGRCAVCGRALTVPESLDRGIGPECWSKTGGG